MPHLLVVVVKTGPVRAEFSEAVFVYIVQPVLPISAPRAGGGRGRGGEGSVGVNVHRNGTPSHPPPFLETVNLALAARLVLAQHVVVIVRAAAVANEEGCRHQRGGGGADFGDGGDGRGQRGFVNQDSLVETVDGESISIRDICFCNCNCNWPLGRWGAVLSRAGEVLTYTDSRLPVPDMMEGSCWRRDGR